MCSLSPSPKKHGYLLGQCALLLDSDFLLSAGQGGSAALTDAYLLREVRGEVRKRHVEVKKFRKAKLCTEAEGLVLHYVAQGAVGDPDHPEARLTATDWSVAIAAACLAKKRAAAKPKSKAPSPILATGEKAIVSVAARIFGLQAQVLVSPRHPNRFWFLIADGPATLEVNTAIQRGALPFAAP